MSDESIHATTNARRWIWISLCCWLLLLRGPAFLGNLSASPPNQLIPDFFQEYASAQAWVNGQPLYGDLHESASRLFGAELNDKRSYVLLNAHPPTAIMLALPLSYLDFNSAFLTWNLVSLGALAASLSIVQRGLKIPFSAWSLAPLLSLLLLCFPLWEQCRLGQLTLILLLLITGTWAADRSGRPWLAGALLGAATCIKLFPGYLFIYYALRRRWGVVITGLLTILILSVLTASILGVEAYRSYFLTVLPEIQWFRVGWNNNSFWGFWSRLFDPSPEHERDRSLTEPLYYSPTLATTLALASSVAITGILALALRRASQGRRCDLTFTLAVTAMLLVSPICWEHYLLLLLVPLASIWVGLPKSGFMRVAFLVIVAAFWLGYPVTWTAFGLNGRVATPVDSVGILSYQFYALLGFFALALLQLGRPPERCVPSPAWSTLVLGSFLMAGLWLHVLHEIWMRYGLFHFIGGDFGIYRSIATATLAEGPRAMYDLDLVAPYARELTPYYGPESHVLNLGPGPYPAVYILPFLALTAVSPPAGYLIWTALGLALAVAVRRGMVARWPDAGWGLIASTVLSFPVVAALIFGQLTMPFFYGFYRAYRSLEEGREFRAGLWSGALYLKPQYAVFMALVFLLKRRWRAFGGLALAGVMVLLGSLAIVGPGGFRDWYGTLREMSGFRDVAPIVGPGWMINWRGLLTTFLPDDISDQAGQALTLSFSALTIMVLPLVWRGEWNPRGERFALQMLATTIIMMMASYHNHIHSASLLLIPGLAVAGQKVRPRYLGTILTTGLYAPLPLYFARASMISVSLLLIALMLAALGTIVYGELAPALGGPASTPEMVARIAT